MKSKILVLETVLILISLMALISCTVKIDEPATNQAEIYFASPNEGNLVDGIVMLSAEIMEQNSIRQVEFYIDGDSLATDIEAPYEVDWNTETAENDIHTLECRAILENSEEILADTIFVTVRNLLFTANYTNGCLPDDMVGYIFISDLEGNILGEAGWIGNTTVEVEHSPLSGIIPERITVTLVNDFSFFDTFFDIPKGSNWTFEGGNPGYESHQVEFNFQNIPEHNGYLFSNLWSAHGSNGALHGESEIFNFRVEPSNFYIKLNTQEFGEKYIWVYNITENNYDVDLSALNFPDSTTINLDYIPDSFHYTLSGYPVPGSHYTGSYYLDYGNLNDASSFTVKYPPGEFIDYKTSIEVYDSEDTYNYWNLDTYGGIPDVITRIGIDCNIISQEPDNFQMQITGTCDEVLSNWIEITGIDHYIYWRVYGPANFDHYSLPTPPAPVFENNPDLAVELFEIYAVRLSDYSPVESYDEVMQIKYESSEIINNVVNSCHSRKMWLNRNESKRKGNSEEEEWMTGRRGIRE